MPPNRHGRRLLLTLGLLLLITVLVRSVSSPRQVRRLADGSTVTLERLTVNQPHQDYPGGWKEQFLAGLSPQLAKAVTGYQPDPLSVDPHVPVVWISWKGTPKMRSLWDFPYRWTVFDADGCETQVELSRQVCTANVAMQQQALGLRTYPRHGSPCGLRLYKTPANAAPRPVAEFPLPALGTPVPRNVLPPAPQTVARDGEVAYELRRFVSGCDQFSALSPPVFDDPTMRFTHVEIATTRKGRPTEEWMPVSFELRGDEGTVLDGGTSYGPKPRGNVTQLSHYQSLVEKERHWRVRVEVARTPRAHFAPEELVVLRKVRVPTRAERPSATAAEPVPVTGNVQGVSVACFGIRWSTLGPPYAEAVVELQGVQRSGLRATLVKATDDSGRDVLVPEGKSRIDELLQAYALMVGHEFPLLIRKPMKTVDLTFAVQRTRFVEFQATPTRPMGPAAQRAQTVTLR